MSQTAKWGNLGAGFANNISTKVRLPGGGAVPWMLSEGGEKAACAQSGFGVEDPLAAASLVGLKEVHFEDSAATDPTLFAGFFDNRNVQRATTRGLRVDAQREWDTSVTDLNVLLSDYIIDSGKRPAETDIQRIDWLLASGYCPIGVTPFIDRTSPTSLPEADYTGRTAYDVLSEASNFSNKNFLVRWEQNCTWPDPASPWYGTMSGGYVAPVGAGWSSTDVLGGQYSDGWGGVGAYQYVGSVYPSTLAYSASHSGSISGTPIPDAYPIVNGGTVPTQHANKWGQPLYAVGGSYAEDVRWTWDLGSALNIATVGLVQWDDEHSNIYPALWTMSIDYSDDGTTWTTLFNDAAIRTSGAHSGTFIGSASGNHQYWSLHIATSGSSVATSVMWLCGGFMLWGGTASGPGPALIYHAYNWSDDVSTLAISNVLADYDGATTFAPGEADQLVRNPARVFSGVWFEFNGGHVYATYAATMAAFRHRDVRASDLNCTTYAGAFALAYAYLSRCNTEEDRFTVHIPGVPSASVNKARPGQRIPVRLWHVTEYANGAYMMIGKRTIMPTVGGRYDMTLELSVPIFTGLRPGQFLSPSLWSANIGQVTRPINVADIGSAVTGQTVTTTFIAYGNGSTVLFTLPSGYISNSLLVFVDDQLVPYSSITETSPTAGTFTLDFAPVGASSSAPAQTVTASWQVA